MASAEGIFNFISEMKLTGKNILIISPEPWTHIHVSKHHYAITLGSMANKVFFLSPPDVIDSCKMTEYENVWSVTYRGFIPGVKFLPSSIKQYIFKKVLQHLENICGVEFQIVWSFDSSVFFDFTSIRKRRIAILHLVDYNQEFQFRTAASTADYCFCTSDFILNRLRTYNAKVYKINHGVYLAPTVGSDSQSLVLPGNNVTKAMYAGNLNIKYLDWQLIEELVVNNSNVDFCFAGTKPRDNGHFDFLLTLDNFFYLGVLTKDGLQNCFQRAQITLLLYKADEYREQLANPHKVMEYLMSGKILIATYTHELRNLHECGLICMSQANREMPALFKHVVKNLSFWNSTDKVAMRKKYALENTYEKQIQKIEQLIKD